MALRNQVFLCSDPVSQTPCPRCGKLEVDLPYYGPPNCYACGWDAGEGPEPWTPQA